MKTIVYVGEERNVATGRHRPIHKLSRALFSAHRNNKRRRRGRKQRRTYYYYNIASFYALAHRLLIILYALPPPPLRTAAARFPGITSPVFSLSPSLSLSLFHLRGDDAARFREQSMRPRNARRVTI